MILERILSLKKGSLVAQAAIQTIYSAKKDIEKAAFEIVDRMPRTSYEITEEGRGAFRKTFNSLRKMIEIGPHI